MKIRIATRRSPMALFQANDVKNKILKQHPDLQIELVEFLTEGDKDLTSSLSDRGGKGLFVKELQKALLNHDADIAVHCIKDLPVRHHPKLILAAICLRDDPRDAFVSNNFKSLIDLPKGAIVGTSSPRRQCLIKSLRSDLETKLLRGNVGTRLSKLDNNEYDAMILAAAGLKRLNESHRIKEYLDPKLFIPAIGQGALGIECRADDIITYSFIQHLNDEKSRYCVEAERAVNRRLGGSCDTPIGAYATINSNQLNLIATIGNFSGEMIHSQISGNIEDAEKLGLLLADDLIHKGAMKYLKP